MSPSRIFISYRRETSAYAAGRLAHDLRQSLPDQQVFQDIASVEPGADFVESLQRALDACVAVLVIIDSEWLTVRDSEGRRRLDVPGDWVRHEVAESLQRAHVRVFPLLLDTEMPRAEDLPEPLRPLARRQALPLTARHWAEDVAKLVAVLRQVPELAPRQAERTPDDIENSAKSGRSAPAATPSPSSAKSRLRVALGAAVLAALAAAAATALDLLPWSRSIAVRGPKPLYLPLKTGDVFQECAECPEMVVIVPDPTLALRDMTEAELRTMKPFAIGKFEVTRRQFAAGGVKTASGCFSSLRKDFDEKITADSPGFDQGADHPIVCVRRAEILSYLRWLNKRNGLKLEYRLPTEVEWAMAASGGARRWQHWGEDSGRSCEFANVFDRTAAQTLAVQLEYDCEDGFATTAPVGRFKPNALGVHDTIGNVWEWLEDCGTHAGRRECGLHVLVGGSWAPSGVMDYRRHYEEADDVASDNRGFRAARTLEPP